MKSVILAVVTGILFFSGCAGQTTDPRKGGLFSYDPQAYERRLAERQAKLDAVENDTGRQRQESRKLKRQL